MKKLLLLFITFTVSITSYATDYIRVNQMGYLEHDIKVAVLLMQEAKTIDNFSIVNVVTNDTILLTSVRNMGKQPPFAEITRLDFSSITQPGRYIIIAGDTSSPEFIIDNKAYAGANEIPLKYMRQQRCGDNPFLNIKCHQHDGIVVLHPTLGGTKVDVKGGWHDASDYLQYVTTSANATYQMMFAYYLTPHVWGDKYDASGREGSNGIPDILDEAKWGLDWLIKMNPCDSVFFNQIADDRDHKMMLLPFQDKVDYGWGEGKERPVYPCIGKPNGLREYKNESTGLASTLGKYASTFSLGAEIFKNTYPEFSEKLKAKAQNAYDIGAQNPGVCQTACCVSPYYYEEDNWSDDMQLAAATLYKATGSAKYLQDAVEYGRLEPTTPWFGADSARHYQWYPFINLGHYHLATCNNARVKAEFIRNLRSGLQRVADRASGNGFLNGIPFIWCSNNLTVAFITQAMLYRKITGDNSFQEIETAMRDWLFGVNPWGKCMIIGLPHNGDYPTDPHSAFTNLHGYPIDGGLVDGPVYASIFNSLKGVHLRNIDRYAEFQSDIVVYHDDFSDYATNEPTMDGTASMTYFLGILAAEALK